MFLKKTLLNLRPNEAMLQSDMSMKPPLYDWHEKGPPGQACAPKLRVMFAFIQPCAHSAFLRSFHRLQSTNLSPNTIRSSSSPYACPHPY